MELEAVSTVNLHELAVRLKALSTIETQQLLEILEWKQLLTTSVTESWLQKSEYVDARWYLKAHDHTYKIFVAPDLCSGQELETNFRKGSGAAKHIDNGRLAKGLVGMLDRVTNEASYKEHTKMSYEDRTQFMPAASINIENEITNYLKAVQTLNHEHMYKNYADSTNKMARFRLAAWHDSDIRFIIKIDYSQRETEHTFRAWLYAVNMASIKWWGYKYTDYPVLYFQKTA